MRTNPGTGTVLVLLAGIATGIVCTGGGAQAQNAPGFHYDPAWPGPLPNLWKMGGVTGLAVDSNDNVWVYNRPNDAIATELRAEPTPPIALCCVRPPSMIHIDRDGNVIGSFDAPQGHGMDVDDDGFVYLGQDTVRKYDPATGQIVAEVARTPQRDPDPEDDPSGSAAFREQYPPETPMIVGGLEEIRIIEEDNEMYVADNYLGGRVLVFDLDTFELKRGWGAYGKPLAEISTDEADHAYTPQRPHAAGVRGPPDAERLQRRSRLRRRPQREPDSRDDQGRAVPGRVHPGTEHRGRGAPPAAWRSRRIPGSSTSTSRISPTTGSGSWTAIRVNSWERWAT